MVEEKCALPHDKLILEEDRRDEFCGNIVRLAEERGGGAAGIAASLHTPLRVERDVCCVLAWDAQPVGRR